MKSIVLYYSYGGHTKKAAEKLARAQGADVEAIQTVKRHGKLTTYLVDCPKALRGKGTPIVPIKADLTQYDMITLASPVWASNPAPAFNEVVTQLPKGKNVQVLLVSASGEGATSRNAEKIRKRIRHQGCTVVSYKDVKQS